VSLKTTFVQVVIVALEKGSTIVNQVVTNSADQSNAATTAKTQVQAAAASGALKSAFPTASSVSFVATDGTVETVPVVEDDDDDDDDFGEWWHILLIVVGALLILGLIGFLVWKFCLNKKAAGAGPEQALHRALQLKDSHYIVQGTTIV